jgi:glycerophosphoryl diester phosphodiesterase
MSMRWLFLPAALLLGAAGTVTLRPQPRPVVLAVPTPWPLVIARCGGPAASAYRRASEEGADFIELDVVAARDGELIVGHDGPNGVLTFDEAVALAGELGRSRGRPLGLFVETRDAAHSRAAGLPLEEKLVASLRRAGLDRIDAPVILQSFDADSLRRFGELTDLPRVLMLPHGRPCPPRPWDELAAEVDGIGPDLRLLADPGLVAAAHRHGLRVYPWTFREGADYAGPLRSGVDGVITNVPAEATAAVRR